MPDRTLSGELAGLQARLAALEARTAEDRVAMNARFDNLRTELHGQYSTRDQIALAHPSRQELADAAQAAAVAHDRAARRGRELLLIPVGLLSAAATLLSILSQLHVLGH